MLPSRQQFSCHTGCDTYYLRSTASPFTQSIYNMADEILNDISHRRYNPLRGTWLLVSPHRTKRPWQGQQEAPTKTSLPEYDPKCYLCPGNQRAQGDSNPNYTGTFSFINDYSAVKENQPPYTPDSPPASQLFKAESVTGKCYVLTFSPTHNLTLADMSPAEILPVIKTWTAIYASHLSPTSTLRPAAERSVGTIPIETTQMLPPPPKEQLGYMQIFENKGAAMGCSNPHPHGQIWTTSHIPEEPAAEMANMLKYRAQNGGRNLLGDYAALEAGKGDERVIWQNDRFLVVCPWWAVWPYEVLVIPKRHVRALVDLNEGEMVAFAEAVGEVTRRYDNLFESSFPYSSGIHQAPLNGTPEEIESSYLHMHFYPPLLRSATVKKFLVGYEMMAEPQRDITPEQAAAKLRDCGGPLYRKTVTE